MTTHGGLCRTRSVAGTPCEERQRVGHGAVAHAEATPRPPRCGAASPESGPARGPTEWRDVINPRIARFTNTAGCEHLHRLTSMWYDEASWLASSARTAQFGSLGGCRFRCSGRRGPVGGMMWETRRLAFEGATGLGRSCVCWVLQQCFRALLC